MHKLVIVSGCYIRQRDKCEVSANFFCAFAKLANSDHYLRFTSPSVQPSVWNKSAPAGQIYVKFYIGGLH